MTTRRSVKPACGGGGQGRSAGVTCARLEQARGDHTAEGEAERACWHLNVPSVPGTEHSFQGLWGSVARCRL